MNRAARRAERNRTPRHLRDVMVIDLTREQAAQYFPPSMADGDICTIAGLRAEVRDGHRVIVRCEKGRETPFKLGLRK